MKAIYTDKIRNNYKIYLEPILATACVHQGERIGITRSKYIRYAVINQLIKDKYPLKRMSNKFNAFYKGLSI